MTADDLIVPEDTVMALAFSADGRRAAVGTAGRRVIVHDAASWRRKTARLSRHSRGITGVSFSPDGRRLASSSGRYFGITLPEANDSPGEVIVWDTVTWQDCLTLTHPVASEFAAVGFGDGGRTLYAASNPVAVSPGQLPQGEIVRWSTKAGGATNGAGPLTLSPPAAPSRPVSLGSRPLDGVETSSCVASSWVSAGSSA